MSKLKVNWKTSLNIFSISRSKAEQCLIGKHDRSFVFIYSSFLTNRSPVRLTIRKEIKVRDGREEEKENISFDFALFIEKRVGVWEKQEEENFSPNTWTSFYYFKGNIVYLDWKISQKLNFLMQVKWWSREANIKNFESHRTIDKTRNFLASLAPKLPFFLLQII